MGIGWLNEGGDIIAIDVEGKLTVVGALRLGDAEDLVETVRPGGR